MLYLLIVDQALTPTERWQCALFRWCGLPGGIPRVTVTRFHVRRQSGAVNRLRRMARSLGSRQRDLQQINKGDM